MSQNDHLPQPGFNDLEDAAPITQPEHPPQTAVAPEPAAAAPVEESTIGTGTSMALGCIAGTVVLIIFGLLFLAVSTLV